MISATIAGNIGQDAEQKEVGADTVVSFSVACKTGIKKDDPTTWVRCSMWGKRGTSLYPFLTKGKSVTVSGSLSTREYDGKNGKGFSVELRVNDVALQGGGQESAPPKAFTPRVDSMSRAQAARAHDDDLPF